jgi:hypothetical protein
MRQGQVLRRERASTTTLAPPGVRTASRTPFGSIAATRFAEARRIAVAGKLTFRASAYPAAAAPAAGAMFWFTRNWFAGSYRALI